MIELHAVNCGYKDRTVLSSVNLSIDCGEAIGVLGANGTGKSTLFKSILGMIPYSDGQIFIDSFNLKEMKSTEIARKISYVPQSRKYSYSFKACEVALMGRAAWIGFFSRPKKKDLEKVNAIFEMLNINHLYEKDFSRMSGGEQQIVLLARALVQDTKYIVLDEPTSNLDLLNQKRIVEVIKKLKDDNRGIIISSHNPEHVFSCCDKVALLKDGRCEYGKTDEILTEEKLSELFGTKIKILKGVDEQGNELKNYCLV